MVPNVGGILLPVYLSGQQTQTPVTMNTTNTLRSNQVLVTFNGFGSSSGTYYAKGDSVSEVMQDLLSGVGKSDADADPLKRQRTTFAKLVSEKTGRTLREWSEAELLKLKASI